jgi:ribosomal protein S26
MSDVPSETECSHGEVKLLGEQKGEKGTNKYFKCLKCGNVLVLSEDGVLYEVPKENKRFHPI